MPAEPLYLIYRATKWEEPSLVMWEEIRDLCFSILGKQPAGERTWRQLAETMKLNDIYAGKHVEVHTIAHAYRIYSNATVPVAFSRQLYFPYTEEKS